jgi:hypothetical protein
MAITKYKDLGIRLASSKQLGQYVLTGTKESISAYIIRSFDGLNPDNIEYIGSMTNDGDTTWDQAYDKLIGKPGKPNFTKVVQL